MNRDDSKVVNVTIKNISAHNQKKKRQKVFSTSLYLAKNLAVLVLIEALGS
jgi:hypothetical protein